MIGKYNLIYIKTIHYQAVLHEHVLVYNTHNKVDKEFRRFDKVVRIFIGLSSNRLSLNVIKSSNLKPYAY